MNDLKGRRQNEEFNAHRSYIKKITRTLMDYHLLSLFTITAAHPVLKILQDFIRTFERILKANLYLCNKNLNIFQDLAETCKHYFL